MAMYSILFTRLFRQFGAKYGYDTTYLQQMAKAYPGKAWLYFLAAPFSLHRSYAPATAYFAAKLQSACLSGCGPCVRLVLAMAREAGVEPHQLRAVLIKDIDQMNAETLLGYRYAIAVHQQAPDLFTIIRDIEVLYGSRGLWDMALAVAYGQFYPMIKRGLGVAVACEPPETLLREIDAE